jgi:hypothetical protein
MGETIDIRSDGSPRKSYLYGSDCAGGYIHVLNTYDHFAGQAVNVDCTPSGNLSKRGILDYVPLEEVLS